MNILIIYATNSGATEIVSQIVEETLAEHKLTVTRKDVTTVTPEELNAYDLIVFGSPSWDFDGKEGWPHEHFIPFMDAVRPMKFQDKKFAIFGLGDSSYTHFCGAVDHLEKLVADVSGKLIIESLKIDGFYFNQAENSEKAKTWAQTLASLAQSNA